jgi:hypothetical protein
MKKCLAQYQEKKEWKNIDNVHTCAAVAFHKAWDFWKVRQKGKVRVVNTGGELIYSHEEIAG